MTSIYNHFITGLADCGIGANKEDEAVNLCKCIEGWVVSRTRNFCIPSKPLDYTPSSMEACDDPNWEACQMGFI